MGYLLRLQRCEDVLGLDRRVETKADQVASMVSDIGMPVVLHRGVTVYPSYSVPEASFTVIPHQEPSHQGHIEGPTQLDQGHIEGDTPHNQGHLEDSTQLHQGDIEGHSCLDQGHIEGRSHLDQGHMESQTYHQSQYQTEHANRVSSPQELPDMEVCENNSEGPKCTSQAATVGDNMRVSDIIAAAMGMTHLDTAAYCGNTNLQQSTIDISALSSPQPPTPLAEPPDDSPTAELEDQDEAMPNVAQW